MRPYRTDEESKSAISREGRRKSDRSRPSPQQLRSPGTFLDSLQASGRYTFSRAEAGKALGLSDVALKNALWRLARTGRVASERPRDRKSTRLNSSHITISYA